MKIEAHERLSELQFKQMGSQLTRLETMIERLEQVDPSSAADEITSEYIEMTVWEALDSLRSPGAGDFFGRIDEPGPRGGTDRWYIGRRHIEDDAHDPVVVDWRAPISAPFYRGCAGLADPLFSFDNAYRNLGVDIGMQVNADREFSEFVNRTFRHADLASLYLNLNFLKSLDDIDRPDRAE